MKTYSFEKLDAWQLAKTYTKEIYQVTKRFPSEEKFSLTNQIRRAAVSIVSNLAEGSGRQSSKEQARYSEIAYSSLMETIAQLIIANELGYLNSSLLDELKRKAGVVSFKINQLRKSQLRRIV